MKKRILSLLPLAFVLAAILCAPAFALTEAEVEAQVAASGKEAVTGNVLIWFLCAVAFLKVSQKIDSWAVPMPSPPRSFQTAPGRRPLPSPAGASSWTRGG